ncbi:MAG: hypothetical protein AB7O73_15730, partial [Bacteroidia bacterium]
AIFIYFIRDKVWKGIMKAVSFDVLNLATAPLAISEIKAATGLWKAFSIVVAAGNSGGFILNSTPIAVQINSTQEGREFLFWYNRALMVANIGYISPFAYKFAKNLVQTYTPAVKGKLQSILPASEFKKVDDAVNEVANGTSIDKIIINTGGVTNSLKKLSEKAYSGNILWKNLDETNIIWANPNTKILSTAKTFANEIGTSLYDLVLSEGYYVKFDLNDGRILLGNTNGNYHAFAVINEANLGSFKSSILNVSNEVFNTKLVEFLSVNADKLKILSDVVTKQLTIAGKIVSLNNSTVNTILGKFRPDIASLFDELGSFKNVGLGETKGGINILNKPDYYYDPITWWSAYNKPWLDKAIGRGDNIYLATIPTKADEIIKNGKLLGAYAEELNHLAFKNYKPTNITVAEWNNIKAWLGY